MSHLCMTRILSSPVSMSKLYSSSSESKLKTAGIISIGDELLKGDVLDTNSNFVSKILFNRGIKLKKILVVGDTIEEVGNEVSSFSSLYDYVVTTGGIGPTHDDITFQGIAKAFNEPLVLNEVLKDICLNYFETSNLESPGMKLAWVPKSAALRFYPGLMFPGISVRNVYVFPGVPQLCQKAFSVMAADLFKSNNRFYTRYVYFNITEDKILTSLNEIVKQFPNVQIGSYPILFDKSYKVKISIESTNEKLTNEVYIKLMELAPKDSIVEPVH